MRPLIGTSWKMHHTASEAATYLDALRPLVAGLVDRDLFVLPAFPALFVARERLTGSNVAWGAQDVHPDDRGAHTGDVSAPMLADLGCRYVEVGHAERRRDHGETAEIVAAKVAAALRWHLTPIVCVGEERREGPETALATVLADLEGCLARVPAAAPRPRRDRLRARLGDRSERDRGTSRRDRRGARGPPLVAGRPRPRRRRRPGDLRRERRRAERVARAGPTRRRRVVRGTPSARSAGVRGDRRDADPTCASTAPGAGFIPP